MRFSIKTTFTFLCFGLLCPAGNAAAQPVAMPVTQVSPTTTSQPFRLGPPQSDGPLVVQASFKLHNINDIDDEAQTFEFEGVLTLKWRDPRQAFDPAAAGVDEKIYQGNFQFNEVSPSWFPQEVLVNGSGMYEKDGVVLRVEPDGTQTLIQTVDAVAKSEFNMRRFPYDRHRLEAVFELLGLDDSEVVLKAESEIVYPSGDTIRVPQWIFGSMGMSTRSRSASYAGRSGVSSAFVLRFDVERESFFIVRLVVFPLAVIALLSFSVFWMDRSSLGDRINVSFIGILTGVAYQIVMSDILPRISYFTLITAFLNISFLTMCATVIINLVVGAMDQKGRHDVGDGIDRRCRWIFPVVYFGLNLLATGIAFTFY